MGRSKAMATDVAEKQPGRPAPIDLAVAALLDHIAEDLAREYVRLMEQAAHHGDADGLHRQEEEP